MQGFSQCLGVVKNETGMESFVDRNIKDVAQKALERLQQKNELKESLKGTSAIIRKYFDQTVKIIIASKDFISLATSANPYAALAWTGVSLLLPVS